MTIFAGEGRLLPVSCRRSLTPRGVSGAAVGSLWVPVASSLVDAAEVVSASGFVSVDVRATYRFSRSNEPEVRGAAAMQTWVVVVV